MATPRVFREFANNQWTDVTGAAASIVGMTWQNIGPGNIYLAFTTNAPAGAATDAVHVLQPTHAYYDKNGSAKIWARAENAGAKLSGTSD